MREDTMTISEIQTVLKTSFKNGFYIYRPAFAFDGIELYINKENKVWQIQNGKVFSVDLMQHELKAQDWVIV